MSSERNRTEPAGPRRRRLRAARLGVLLGILAGLIAYLALPGSSGPHGVAGCAAETGAPQVLKLSASGISSLRDDVARAIPQRVARLYEEGTIKAVSAWTDEEPAPPPVNPRAPRSGGYEMRWWAPNGDDIVADELEFANEQTAARFMQLAASTRCRSHVATEQAPAPPLASNVSWLNPDGAAQADVYLRRANRVFRVADAPAGQRGGQTRPGSLRRAFATIDTLACLLPHAHCTRGSSAGAVPA